MTERSSSKVEKEDIILPKLRPGETSIVFQRHGQYNRDLGAKDSGSIFQDNADELYAYDKSQFDTIFAKSNDTYILFVASDTRYGNGYRGLETAQVAQSAATKSLENAGLNPSEYILNFNQVLK